MVTSQLVKHFFSLLEPNEEIGHYAIEVPTVYLSRVHARCMDEVHGRVLGTRHG